MIDFIILADGDEPNFTETETTSQSRTLSIKLPAGTEEVEIIGSVFGEAAPVEETPVEETPVEETPVEETPVEETPVEETPVEETPVEETPKTQCGPGTVLKDDTCVLESTPQQSTVTVSKRMGSELVIGTIAAFGIAAAIGIILALISRADTRKN